MEVTYKREANAAYMILSEECPCEEYAARVLGENRIEGVMPLSIREIDGKREYYFDVSQGRSLSGVLERRPVTLSEIRRLLEALQEVDDHMEEYLMNVNHMIIEPGMIYLPTRKRDAGMGYERMEIDFRHAVFCCHPACERDFLAQVRGMMQYFLNKLDHMEEHSVEKAYEMFQITQKEYFRLEELLEVCRPVEMMREVREERPEEELPEESPEMLRIEAVKAQEPETAAAAREMSGIPQKRRGEKKQAKKTASEPVVVTRSGVAGISVLMRGLGAGLILAGALLIIGNLWLRMNTGSAPGGIWTYSIWAGGLCMIAGTLVVSAPHSRGQVRRKLRPAAQG